MNNKMKKVFLDAIDKETDVTYQVYLQYITFLLEDSGDMSELPQIKQLASRLTLANGLSQFNKNILLKK